MSCETTRRDLMAAPPGEGVPTGGHLAECAACAAFARELEQTRELLSAHRSDHQPDPHFARRVTAALPGDAELLGWAAVRLLPATLALLLALSAWAWLGTPGPSALVETAPTDDPLVWAIGSEEGS